MHFDIDCKLRLVDVFRVLYTETNSKIDFYWIFVNVSVKILFNCGCFANSVEFDSKIPKRLADNRVFRF